MLESFDPEVYRFSGSLSGVHGLDFDLRPHRNYLSAAVLEALGSPLADLYMEGLPGARFTAGTKEADQLEALGVGRLLALFGGEAGTIQPMTHASAVSAVLNGILSEGDTVLSPEPGSGCSIAFGHEKISSCRELRFVRYGPDAHTLGFDYEAITRLAVRAHPSMIVVSLMPFPRRQDLTFWRGLADRIDALLLVDLFAAAGLVPGGQIPTPASHADIVVGATQGLLRGPPGGFILYRSSLAKGVEEGLFPCQLNGTTANLIAAKTVALKEAASGDFKDYAERCMTNASALSAALAKQGFSVWAGGSDYHYLILDLKPFDLTGLEGERRLAERGVAAARLPLPFGRGCGHQGDGLLLGTQAVTLRGMGTEEMRSIAQTIYLVLTKGDR